MIKRLLFALSLVLLASPAWAGCWCDLRAIAGGADPGLAICADAWSGWHDAPEQPRCSGDPGPCWLDYYTNGRFELFPGPNPVEHWRSFSSVGPAPGAQPCLPLVQPAAMVVWKTPALSAHLHDRALKVRRELVQVRGMIAFFCSSPIKELRALCSMYQRLEGGLVALLVLYTMDALDPPDPAYAAFPPACANALPLLTMAEVTVQGVAAVTQAELDAINAWLTRVRKASNAACQAHATFESASGAVLAHQAGDPAAAAWVRRLTRSHDTLKALVLSRRAQERAQRLVAFGAMTPEATPATCPSEPSAHERVLVATAAAGGDMIAAAATAALMAGTPCVPAGTAPGFLLEGLADEADLDADLASIGLAREVCAAITICSVLTTTALEPVVGTPGQVRVRVTVTPSDGPHTMATAGLTVTLSAPGLVGKTVALVDGSVIVKWGGLVTGTPYAVTATFAEQKNAKYGASAAMATVVVQ